jgi:hypothetical protein
MVWKCERALTCTLEGMGKDVACIELGARDSALKRSSRNGAERIQCHDSILL